MGADGICRRGACCGQSLPKLLRFPSLEIQTMQAKLTKREGLITIQQKGNETINQRKLPHVFSSTSERGIVP